MQPIGVFRQDVQPASAGYLDFSAVQLQFADLEVLR